MKPFGDISDCHDISGLNNNIITRNSKNAGGNSNATYGAHWIESNSNKIIEWKFKCIKQTGDIMIGIVTNKHHLKTDIYPKAKGCYGYFQDGMKTINGEWAHEQHGITEYQSGDIFILQLNLKNKQISIIKNNKTEVAFKSNAIHKIRKILIHDDPNLILHFT